MRSKKTDLQIYADECFPLTTVIYLRSIGYSIKHASELNFINKSDNTHLKYARKMDRTLITLDRDFLGYTKERALKSEGIIVVSTGSNVPKHINLICAKQLRKVKQSSVRHSLLLVTNTKITKI